MDNLLSIVTFTPALAGLILAVFLRGADEMAQRNARWVALFATGLTFVMSLFVVFGFDPDAPGFQFPEERVWMFGLQYKMGVDGLSVMFVVLTAFIMPLVIAASWEVVHRVKEYMISLLLLETFVLGALMSLDLVLFFLFLEAATVPLFLLIGIWGGAGRETASFGALLASAFGAIFLLSAMIVMFTEAGTTDIDRLMDHQFSTETITVLGFDVMGGLQTLLCLALILGLAVKLPIWPLHTWHTNAQARAPIAAAVVLSAILTMLAGYGLLRIALPIFPTGVLYLSPLLFAFASVTALFAAVSALAQTDFRKMTAYVSMVLIAIAAMGLFSVTRQGLDGAILLLLSQGLIASGLVLAGGVLLHRMDTTQMDSFGGLSIRMPVFSVLLLLIIWAALGLPGSAGFVAVFLTLTGLAEARPWAAVLALIALGLIAGALLVAFRRIMRGDLIKERLKSVEDLDLRERLTLLPVGAAVLALGLYPTFVTERISGATDRLAALFEQVQETEDQALLRSRGQIQAVSAAFIDPARDNTAPLAR